MKRLALVIMTLMVIGVSTQAQVTRSSIRNPKPRKFWLKDPISIQEMEARTHRTHIRALQKENRALLKKLEEKEEIIREQQKELEEMRNERTKRDNLTRQLLEEIKKLPAVQSALSGAKKLTHPKKQTE